MLLLRMRAEFEAENTAVERQMLIQQIDRRLDQLDRQIREIEEASRP
jgi:hypothetical protein